eukprot:8677728-Lingulodinium_polyedra.AAC.1
MAGHMKLEVVAQLEPVVNQLQEHGKRLDAAEEKGEVQRKVAEDHEARITALEATVKEVAQTASTAASAIGSASSASAGWRP